MHKNENNSKGPTNGRFGRPRGYMLIVYDLKLATRQKKLAFVYLNWSNISKKVFY